MIVWGAIVLVGVIVLGALAIGVVIYCLFKAIDNSLRKMGF